MNISGFELVSGSYKSWLEIIQAFLKPSLSYIILSPIEPVRKLWGFSQDMGPGSIGCWAFLQRCFFQVQAFEPGGVPVPALQKSCLTLTTDPTFSELSLEPHSCRSAS